MPTSAHDMDAEVIAAMAKWPNVPAVYGWLGLSARGQWRIKGEPIPNETIRAFISRNYASAEGCWFFQNGPQRVFVALECAPLVFRVDSQRGRHALRAHTGAVARTLEHAAWIIDGPLMLATDLGPGNLDDRDSAVALTALCDRAGRSLEDAAIQRWLQGESPAYLKSVAFGLGGPVLPLERLAREDVPQRFGFDPDPQPA